MAVIEDELLARKNQQTTASIFVTTGGGGGTGNVTGPGTATDHAVARWDGTSGQLLENSVVLVSDGGAMSGLTSLTLTAGELIDTSYGANWLTFKADGGLAYVGTAANPQFRLIEGISGSGRMLQLLANTTNSSIDIVSTFSATGAWPLRLMMSSVAALAIDTSSNVTLSADLRVDGGDIGLTADTDMIQMVANTSVTVNAALTVGGNLLPNAAGTRTFGSTDLEWATGYFSGSIYLGATQAGRIYHDGTDTVITG